MRILLLRFLLTVMAIAFVAIDIRSAPESPVLKWGFVPLTAYRPVRRILLCAGIPGTAAWTP
jgi:hypothetical protein